MEIAETNVIKTTFQCPRCGRNLIITEKKGITFFGCTKCDCYIIVQPWQVREFKRGGYFNWRDFMKYIYRSYINARDYVCK